LSSCRRSRRPFRAGWAPAVSFAFLFAAPCPLRADDGLATVRAAYEALSSYSDTGTVVVELGVSGAPPLVERARLETRFRAPNDFLLSYREEGEEGDHLALWARAGRFRSWWSVVGAVEEHGEAGGPAFATADYTTNGAATLVASVLLPELALHTPLTDLRDLREVADETIDGRLCRRLQAETAFHFGSSRPLTLWIDAETRLLRRLVLDTPVGSPAGTLDRVTVTLEPRIAPELGDEAFTFLPPR